MSSALSLYPFNKICQSQKIEQKRRAFAPAQIRNLSLIITNSGHKLPNLGLKTKNKDN